MAKNKFPKETGGGWYELSNGEKVQGEDEAKAQEEALAGNSGDSGSDDAVAARADEGTGLESLAVDREGAKGTGETIGDDEDDPRRDSPVAGMAVIGRAESGEPIVAGGVPTMTTGVSAEDAGVNDPSINVGLSADQALANFEADKAENGDKYAEQAKKSYDGSPVDRLKVTGSQNPTDGGTATDVD